jgi:S1-C subfamily serine protease
MAARRKHAQIVDMSDTPSPGLPSGLSTFSDRLASLGALGAARTVAVHGRDGRARSGLLWAEGLVVTAEEALERDDELALTLPDGREVAAGLAGRDPGTDVALLRAETGPLPAFELAPAEALAAGHLVLAIGRDEHGPLVAFGAATQVAGPWRSMRGGRLERRIQLGLRLDPACEGGAVLDHAGRLVGMAVPGPRRRALAIPAETIARSVEHIRRHGRVARGYLGLALQPVRAEGMRGLIVVGIDPKSPAGEAGLLLGDVLAAWDGAPLGSVREMLARLDPESIGTEVALDLIRGGEQRRVTVRIGERAAA